MPTNFTCPHCGTTTNVADQYAGQSGPCAHCGKTITIPLPEDIFASGCAGLPPKRKIGIGWTVAIVLTAAVFVVLVCGGLMLPPVGAPRESMRRVQCRNNLMQIGRAMHNYAMANKRFPPAFISGKDGKPMHSWRVLLLPYMEEEQKALYNQYRFDEPWDGPHNKALASQMPSFYACPTDKAPGGSVTSYAMIVGPHAISDGPTARSFGDIKDGLSYTIMVAEAADASINWMEPRDIKTVDMVFHINRNTDGKASASDISSRHAVGANVLFGDGTVRFLSGSVDPKILKAMTTIDGGEKTMQPEDY